MKVFGGARTAMEGNISAIEGHSEVSEKATPEGKTQYANLQQAIRPVFVDFAQEGSLTESDFAALTHSIGERPTSNGAEKLLFDSADKDRDGKSNRKIVVRQRGQGQGW